MRTRGRPVTETQGSQAGAGRRDGARRARPVGRRRQVPAPPGQLAHSGTGWRAQASPLRCVPPGQSRRWRMSTPRGPSSPRREAWTQTGPVGTIPVPASRQLRDRRKGGDENRPDAPHGGGPPRHAAARPGQRTHRPRTSTPRDPPPPRREAWTQTGPVGTIPVPASRQLRDRRKGGDENRPDAPCQRAHRGQVPAGPEPRSAPDAYSKPAAADGPTETSAPRRDHFARRQATQGETCGAERRIVRRGQEVLSWAWWPDAKWISWRAGRERRRRRAGDAACRGRPAQCGAPARR
jgi:hypothetical protein